MRMYRVIYDCINEIESAMKGMLAPKFKEVALGQAEVRQVYKITGVGFVAGCYVTDHENQLLNFFLRVGLLRRVFVDDGKQVKRHGFSGVLTLAQNPLTIIFRFAMMHP